MTGNVHAKSCDDCGEDLELIVSGITNHGGSRYTGGNGHYAVHVKVACDCTVEKAQATELTTIGFHGDPPEGWS